MKTVPNQCFYALLTSDLLVVGSAVPPASRPRLGLSAASFSATPDVYTTSPQ